MIRRLLLSAVVALAATAPLRAASDLVLDAGSVPYARVGGGLPLRIRFTIYNYGPDAAPDSLLTVDVPPGFSVVDKPSVCDDRRPMTCVTGSVAAKSYGAANDITFIAPHANESVTFRASVRSTGSDPNLANNVAAADVQIVDAPDLQLSFSYSTLGAIEPGGTFTLQTTIQNQGTAADGVRAHFAAEDGEIVSADSKEWNCVSDNGALDCSLASLPGRDAFHELAYTQLQLTGRAGDSHAGGMVSVRGTVTSSAADANTRDNSDSRSFLRRRWIEVTTVADSGAGSLRDAIETANTTCAANADCQISFLIPPPVPAEGWFTVQPLTPLPELTATRTYIDGGTQTALTGDTNPAGPEVAVDGRRAGAGDGIVYRRPCHLLVSGLSIGNFARYGVAVYGRTSIDFDKCPIDGERAIRGNRIGTDPTGAQPWPNMRGVAVENGPLGITVIGNRISDSLRSGVWVVGSGFVLVYDNRIERNGASGVFTSLAQCQIGGNTIAGNREMGVAIARNSDGVSVISNSMHGNGGLPIDVGLDGVDPPRPDSERWGPGNAPSMFSAVYDPGTDSTTLTASLSSGPVSSAAGMTFFSVEFFANDAANGQGEVPLGQAALDPLVSHVCRLTVKKNLEGKWINAAATRLLVQGAKSIPVTGHAYTGNVYFTSEMSSTVQVGR